MRKLFFWSGILGLILTIIYTFYLIDFKSKASLVQGEIIDFREVKGEYKNFYPIVKLYLNNDEYKIIELERSVSPSFWSKGEIVEVYYNYESSVGRMAGFFSYWQPLFIGLFVSAIFTRMGLWKKFWSIFG